MLKTRRNIATAYLALVAQHSILNVSNDAIIEASGVSRGTFYNNFADQHDILDYIQEQVDIKLIQPIKQKFAMFPTDDITSDTTILVISEVLIPLIYQQRGLIQKLTQCDLSHLWGPDIMKECQRFIKPLLKERHVQSDNYKVMIGYIELLLESWIAEPEITSPLEFKSEFGKLLRQSVIELIK